MRIWVCNILHILFSCVILSVQGWVINQKIYDLLTLLKHVAICLINILWVKREQLCISGEVGHLRCGPRRQTNWKVNRETCAQYSKFWKRAFFCQMLYYTGVIWMQILKGKKVQMYLNVNAIFLGEAWQVLIGCVGFECRKLWSLGTGGFWVSSRPTVLNSCQSKHKGRTRVSVAPTNSRGIRLNSTGNVKITMMAVTFCQQRCTVSFLWTKS